MNMGSMSDYTLGKIRFQELESEARRALGREELLGQTGIRYPRALSMGFSTAFCLAVGAMVLGVNLLGM
ncbi:MAG: hypothetical protein AAF629_02080 [Chloroflexota bacterium]